ncbi:MAG: four helix bundle protein [Fodinibius sp.]|nr:four helix bundle protein [Fodinibius sp.]
MRKPAKTFKDLIVWQKAHEFVLEVYSQTEDFPKSEMYGLTSQFRRAAVSIAANIAEGFKKRGKNETKCDIMNISQGSLEECRYYITLSNDLGYLGESELTPKIQDVSKLIDAYSKAILSSDS